MRLSAVTGEKIIDNSLFFPFGNDLRGLSVLRFSTTFLEPFASMCFEGGSRREWSWGNCLNSFRWSHIDANSPGWVCEYEILILYDAASSANRESFAGV